MKRRIFTLCLGAFFVSAAFAQPEGVIKKATTEPEIDGVIDEVWAEANVYDIDQNYTGETPTLGEAGATTWKALWAETGIYVLIEVEDDVFFPHYSVDPPGNNWEFDKPEIYFDVNYVLADGQGPGTSGSGHHQIAPGFTDGSNDGTAITEDNGLVYAFMVANPTYIGEYFIPFSILTDKDGARISLVETIGFDVTIIDRDDEAGSRQRAVWANTGENGESYSNMDGAGTITFEGAEANTYVESISLTGGAITENNGTLQIQAEVLPEDATEKTLRWTVTNGTGRATINSDGVLTGVVDGDVTVTAAAVDGSYEEATVDVTITGQIITINELNEIKNGNFDMVNAESGEATFWGGWGGDAGSPMPQIVNGVAVCTPVEAAEVWQYQFNQTGLNCLPDIPYEFKFKAWADADRQINVDFEDSPGNGYNRYGSTTDPRSADGRSEWVIDLTTEPQWITLDVVFDQMVETTVQKVQYMMGLAGDIVYLDSISLINTDDLALLTEYIPVTSVTVTGADGAETVAMGSTLQLNAVVLPAEADYPDVTWSVENYVDSDSTGEATIDENGVLTPVAEGTVMVTAAVNDDSGVYGMLEITIGEEVVGINHYNVDIFNVYPNPATDQLHVVLKDNNTRVSVFNSVGKQVDEAFVTGTKHTFDVSNYAKGVYFVKTDKAVVKFVK